MGSLCQACAQGRTGRSFLCTCHGLSLGPYGPSAPQGLELTYSHLLWSPAQTDYDTTLFGFKLVL